MQKNVDIILGNSHEEENPAKIPLYRCIKSTKKRPQTGAPSPSRYISISLSPMCYTQLSVCSNEEHNSSIYALSVT